MISIFVFSVIIEKNSWRTGERVVKRLVKGLSILCQKTRWNETRVLISIIYSLFKYRQPFC